VFKVF